MLWSFSIAKTGCHVAFSVTNASEVLFNDCER